MSSIINAIFYREPTVETASVETQTDPEPTPSETGATGLIYNKPTLWRVTVSYMYQPIDCCGRGVGDRYISQFAVIYASSEAEAKCHFVAQDEIEKGYDIEVAPYKLGEWMEGEDGMFCG